MKPTEHFVLSPNQVVAHNLYRARTLRGLTQEQAAERLEPFLGTRWSKAAVSAAERSVEGRRIRHFTADDIVAFARAFDLPVSWFFLPPERDVHRKIGLVAVPDVAPPAAAIPGLLLDVIAGTPSGRAAMEQRVEQLLAELPAEYRSNFYRHWQNVAPKLSALLLKESLGDLSVWSQNLRDLAGTLDDVASRTVDQLVNALTRAGTAGARELTGDDVARVEVQDVESPDAAAQRRHTDDRHDEDRYMNWKVQLENAQQHRERRERELQGLQYEGQRGEQP